MKFTKEQALENLKAYLGDTTKGRTLKLSDRTINEQLDTLLPLIANDEMELTDFIAKVTPVFVSANGNVGHDVSAYIKDYEAKNPKPTPQPAPTPSATPTGGLTAEDIAKIVAAANQPLVEKLAAFEVAKTKEEILKQGLAKFMESKPSAERQAMIDKAYKTVSSSVSDKTTVEELSAAIKAEYDELVSLSGLNGYEPVVNGGGDAKTSAEEFAAEIARLKEMGKLPADKQA